MGLSPFPAYFEKTIYRDTLHKHFNMSENHDMHLRVFFYTHRAMPLLLKAKPTNIFPSLCFMRGWFCNNLNASKKDITMIILVKNEENKQKCVPRKSIMPLRRKCEIILDNKAVL